MIFNNKPSEDNSIINILSNDKLAEFLDSFKWEYDEFYHAEFITMEKIQEKSIVLASIIDKINKMKLGDSTYTKNGHIIYRRNKNLPKPKKLEKKTFSVRPI